MKNIFSKFIGLILFASFLNLTGINNLSAEPTFSGDLRIRDVASKLKENEVVSSKLRTQLRARVQLKAKVNQQTMVYIRLGTGNLGQGLSNNQILGSDGSKKSISLDRAEVQYKISNKTMVFAGKMENSLKKKTGLPVQLAWDSDYTPEGINLLHTLSQKQSGLKTFINLAIHWIKEGASLSESVLMYGANLSLKKKGLEFDISTYQFQGTKKNISLIPNLSSSAYKIVQVYAMKQIKPMIKAQASYLKNMSALENKGVAWMAGFSYGNIKKIGRHMWSYSYVQMKKYSIYPGVRNSDFFDGRADGEGHIISYANKLKKNTKIKFNYYHNKNIGDDEPTSYKALQASLVFNF